jgi:hypothetical protein
VQVKAEEMKCTLISFHRKAGHNHDINLAGRFFENVFKYLGTAVKTKKLNSMVGVRKRTIPTERPPLVGEVIANFCG